MQIELPQNIKKKCHDNSYRIVNVLAHEARKLANKYDNKITHAEAISYVIAGNEPDMPTVRDKLTPKTKQDLDNALSDIFEEDIRNSVKASLYTSVQNKEMWYDYLGITDETKQARIRILTNMLYAEYCKPILKKDVI